MIEAYILKDDGRFPNNEKLPVLVYKAVFILPKLFPGNYIKRIFAANGWTNAWKDGIYPYNHYHSNTHEVLGILKGKTCLLLGGNHGITVTLEKGDAIVIPAGVAHKNLQPKDDVLCIGAYPGGKQYDMNYGVPSERSGSDKNIAMVAMPQKDPVFGNGPLQEHWR